MGLAPSRQVYLANADGTPLPFISRAPEKYQYTSNHGPMQRPSRDDGGDDVSGSAANQNGNGSRMDEDGESESGGKPTRKGPTGNGRKERAGARAGGAPAAMVDYYEHRLLPLTREFFPSPRSVLFEQLLTARYLQNPRYHFQMEETWSPGAYVDPTISYSSFEELAVGAMRDLEQAAAEAVDATMSAATSGGEAKGPATTTATMTVEEGEAKVASIKAAMAQLQSEFRQLMQDKIAKGIPFATKQELYDMLVETTESSVVYRDNTALQKAVQQLLRRLEKKNEEDEENENGNEQFAYRADAEESDTALQPTDRHVLRPLPCAVVLLRTKISADQYRQTYYQASCQRHHKGGQNAPNRRRRNNVMDEMKEIKVTMGDVLRAVEDAEAQREMSASGATGVEGRAEAAVVTEEEAEDTWLKLRLQQNPSEEVELRVVGLYGYWTVQEILRHTLFVPESMTATPTAVGESGGGPNQSQSQKKNKRAATREAIDELLAKAAPYGVPARTLLNVSFFEKQVGDKEQCHTFFTLCRTFARGVRESLGGPDVTVDGSGASSSFTDGPPPQENLWARLMSTLTSQHPSHGPACGMDLSFAFLIRFSNVPQLQLSRQVRLMLNELRALYPKPPKLTYFQEAQRNRNMQLIANKQSGGGATSVAGRVAGLPTPPSRAKGGDRGSGPSSNVITPLQQQQNQQQPPLGPAGCEPLSPPLPVSNASASSHRRGAPLALDPEAINLPTHPSAMEQLEMTGIGCYIAHGIVVMRVSHEAATKALFQFAYMAVEDSVEALGVTLTVATPDALTFRGELRLPELFLTGKSTHGVSGSSNGNTSGLSMEVLGNSASHMNATASGGVSAAVPGGGMNYGMNTGPYMMSDPIDVSGGGGGMGNNSPMRFNSTQRRGSANSALGSSAVLAPMQNRELVDSIEEFYCNAARYSRDADRGFPRVRLFSTYHHHSDSVHDEDGGEEERHDCSEDADRFALQKTPKELIGVIPRTRGERLRGNLLPIHSSHSFQCDAYVVSAEFDGKPFQYVLDVTQQVLAATVAQQPHQQQQQQQQYQHLSPGAPFLPGPTAFGDSSPDSVFGWSPMAHYRGGRGAANSSNHGINTAAIQRGGGYYGGGGGEFNPMDGMAMSSNNNNTSMPLIPNVCLREPNRILRQGDIIRYCTAASPVSTMARSPNAGARTPNSRRRSRGDGPSVGVWYVDDELNSEDLILSWMRRVGGRAREARAPDTKWVRYPDLLLRRIIHHREELSRRVGTEVAERWNATSDDLNQYIEIMRFRRFRQWRFSNDGHVYFHGVTVRLPGPSPSPGAPPPPPQQQQQQQLMNTSLVTGEANAPTGNAGGALTFAPLSDRFRVEDDGEEPRDVETTLARLPSGEHLMSPLQQQQQQGSMPSVSPTPVVTVGVTSSPFPQVQFNASRTGTGQTPTPYGPPTNAGMSLPLPRSSQHPRPPPLQTPPPTADTVNPATNTNYTPSVVVGFNPPEQQQQQHQLPVPLPQRSAAPMVTVGQPGFATGAASAQTNHSSQSTTIISGGGTSHTGAPIQSGPYAMVDDHGRDPASSGSGLQGGVSSHHHHHSQQSYPGQQQWGLSAPGHGGYGVQGMEQGGPGGAGGQPGPYYQNSPAINATTRSPVSTASYSNTGANLFPGAYPRQSHISLFFDDPDSQSRQLDHIDSNSFLGTPSVGPVHVTESFFEQSSASASMGAGVSGGLPSEFYAVAGGGHTRSPTLAAAGSSPAVSAQQFYSAHQQQQQQQSQSQPPSQRYQLPRGNSMRGPVTPTVQPQQARPLQPSLASRRHMQQQHDAAVAAGLAESTGGGAPQGGAPVSAATPSSAAHQQQPQTSSSTSHTRAHVATSPVTQQQQPETSGADSRREPVDIITNEDRTLNVTLRRRSHHGSWHASRANQPTSTHSIHSPALADTTEGGFSGSSQPPPLTQYGAMGMSPGGAEDLQPPARPSPLSTTPPPATQQTPPPPAIAMGGGATGIATSSSATYQLPRSQSLRATTSGLGERRASHNPYAYGPSATTNANNASGRISPGASSLSHSRPQSFYNSAGAPGALAGVGGGGQQNASSMRYPGEEYDDFLADDQQPVMYGSGAAMHTNASGGEFQKESSQPFLYQQPSDPAAAGGGNVTSQPQQSSYYYYSMQDSYRSVNNPNNSGGGGDDFYSGGGAMTALPTSEVMPQVRLPPNRAQQGHAAHGGPRYVDPGVGGSDMTVVGGGNNQSTNASSASGKHSASPPQPQPSPLSSSLRGGPAAAAVPSGAPHDRFVIIHEEDQYTAPPKPHGTAAAAARPHRPSEGHRHQPYALPQSHTYGPSGIPASAAGGGAPRSPQQRQSVVSFSSSSTTTAGGAHSVAGASSTNGEGVATFVSSARHHHHHHQQQQPPLQAEQQFNCVYVSSNVSNPIIPSTRTQPRWYNYQQPNQPPQ